MIDSDRTLGPSTAEGSRRGRSDAPLDRVFRALNHPIRRRILRALVDESASASVLSKKLHLNLGVASYHLNQVLAKECRVVELVESVPRRGAVEKLYRLKFQTSPDGGSASDGDPEYARRSMSLEEFFIVAVAAMDADALEVAEGSTWEWFLAQVDPKGWDEIRLASADFSDRVRVAVADSRERGKESKAQDIMVGVAAFPAASPSAS